MIRVGTSGYAYDHWRHVFYPKGLPTRRWLEHYARVFSTVELNTTFLPAADPERRRRLARKNAGRVPLRGQGQSVSHPHEEADGPWTGDRALLRGHSSPGKKLSWSSGSSRPDEPGRPRAAGALPGTTPQARLAARGRVPEPELVLGRSVCGVLDAWGAAFCEARPGPPAPPRLTGGFRVPPLFTGQPGSTQWTGTGRGPFALFAQDLTTWPGDSYVYFNNDQFGHASAMRWT